jgi:WD40 repeat protein
VSSHDTPIVLTLDPISLDHGPLRDFGGFDFTPDGRTLIVGHFFWEDRALTAWDTTSWAKRWSTPTRDTPFDVAVGRDGRWVATGVRSPTRGARLALGCRHGAAIGTVGTSQGLWGPLAALPGERLLVGERPSSGPASLSVWDARGGTLLRRCCDSTAGISAMTVDRVGEHVVTYAEGRLSMWDLRSGDKIHDFGGARGRWPSNTASVAPALAFQPAGDRVILGGLVNEAGPAVFDAATGHKVVDLPGVRAESVAGAVTVSPCGRWLVGAYGWQEDDHWPWQDLGLRVWDLVTGQLALHVEMLGSPLWRLAFSPDGSLLVAGNVDGLQVWRVGMAAAAEEGDSR